MISAGLLLSLPGTLLQSRDEIVPAHRVRGRREAPPRRRPVAEAEEASDEPIAVDAGQLIAGLLQLPGGHDRLLAGAIRRGELNAA
jgi:hypothetical protein